MTSQQVPDRQRVSSQLVGMIFVLLAIVSWGVYFSFAIVILRKITVIEFLMFRWGFGAATLLLVNLWAGKSLKVARQDWPVVLSAIAVGIVIHQFMQVSGLNFTTSTNTGWILTLVPPVTGVLGWVFLRERMHLWQIMGLVVAMSGVALFVTNGDIGELSIGRNKGDLLVLASVFTWSIYTILTKSRLRKYDALGLSIIYMIIGFGAFLIMKLFESGIHIPDLTPSEWFTIACIGVFPSGLAYYWWNAGLQRLTAVNTSMFLFIEAIVASVFGAIVLGEAFSVAMGAFAIIIVIGVTIAQWKRNGAAT